jgi:acetylornithine deacetylase/succinyl-diaminopimelate desuccinylase-like protein
VSAGPAREAVERARDLLAELVDIASPSGSEGAIVDRVERFCTQAEVPSHRVASETGRDSLVVGALEPELVIAAHVDTISPTWPARAAVDGDVVRGLGAVDDKGGVVACVTAAEALAGAGEDLEGLGVAFAFPVDEERGGSGSRTLALALRPAYAIALEATGLRPGIRESGDLDAWVHVEGRSAHGALADIGDNAIHSAVRLIAALPELELGRFTDELIGSSQAEVGAIRGGTDFNTIPDLCSFQLQVRIVPGQDGRETLAAVERLAASHGGRVELVESTDPFVTDRESPVVTELVAATGAATGSDPEPLGVPAWTDAHNFVDFAGSEAVVYGPGDFATAHTPDEYVDVNDVVRCAEVFAALARRGWRR